MPSQRVCWSERRDGELRFLTGEWGRFRLEVLPELGAKLTSLVDTASGYEYLAQPERRYRLAAYGDPFEAYDISGWDECFPAIGEAAYPESPWEGVIVPDHGELWSRPWKVDISGDVLCSEIEGVRFPYRFERRITPRTDGFVLSYSVQNTSGSLFKCFWSTHPLLHATPSTRIQIPTRMIVVEVSFDGRLGPPLAEHSWPVTLDREGRQIDLGLMGPVGQGTADKLYATSVEKGRAGVYEPELDHWLVFWFSTERVPFVGLWANRSGWPTGSPSYNVALEPCSGWPDRLDVAVERGGHTVLAAGATLEWDLQVLLGRGAEPFGDALLGSA